MRRKFTAAALGVLMAVAVVIFIGPSAAYAYSSTDTNGPYPWPHNGCSSPFGDAPAGVSFTYACNHHDGCYNKHWASKETCDLWFSNDMNAACNSSKRSASVVANCRKWASWYYYAVKAVGFSFYSCRCDPTIRIPIYFA